MDPGGFLWENNIGIINPPSPSLPLRDNLFVCLLPNKQPTLGKQVDIRNNQAWVNKLLKKTRKEKSSAAKEHALETETAEPAQMNIFLQNISQINIFLQNISLFTKWSCCVISFLFWQLSFPLGWYSFAISFLRRPVRKTKRLFCETREEAEIDVILSIGCSFQTMAHICGWPYIRCRLT